MEKLYTSVYSSISPGISDEIRVGKSTMGFSVKVVLNNQFGELLAYDWLYSRKPKNPI